MSSKIGNQFHKDNINRYLKGKQNIFDIGSGPEGSIWWQEVPDTAKIVAIDLHFFPKKLRRNIKVYVFDATKLADLTKTDQIQQYHARTFRKNTIVRVDWDQSFDMVVANHILEHVVDPEMVIIGMSKILKKGGIVYTGFPDGKNFTDTFYHLIHPDGGGHIQRLTYKHVKRIFEKHGFQIIQANIWPDDWLWLQKLYDYKSRNLAFITQKDIDYLVKTFRRELTVKKGYYYGWEMVLQKK